MQMQKELDVVYLAKRPLPAGDDVIQPGAIVDTSNWSERIRRIHVDLEWIAPMMVSDASREEVVKQWEAEESAREERRKQRPEHEVVEPPPPPAPPAKRVYCKNCSAAYDFAEVPEDHDRFQCTFCHQWQAVSDAKATSGYGRHGADWYPVS
jgi:hypothetical protein